MKPNDQAPPGLTITQDDLAEAVRSTAMLADVSIGMWGGEKPDAAAMEKVKADAGATGEVGRVVKKLLAGAEGPLKEVRAAYIAVRQVHYDLTLPWISNPHSQRQSGARLLPNRLWDRYVRDTADAKKVALARLDTFIDAYPDLVRQAQANLGDLANGLDYPPPDEVRAKFYVRIDFEPIPSARSMPTAHLPEAWLGKLSKALVAKHARMIETANHAMWEQAKEKIAAMVARLTSTTPKGEPVTFRLETIENVRELMTLLPGWNVAGDERVTEIVSDIRRMLDGVDSPAIRKHDDVRARVTQDAMGVLNRLQQWGV